MLALLEKENNKEKNRIAKPDFNTKTGREFLAFYLQTRLKQIVLYDKKSEIPILKEVNNNFISKFTRRLVCDYKKRILIAVTGESASGKSTICNNLKDIISKFSMPVEIINADNYFNDISKLISKHGDFDTLRDSGYDVDAPENFQLELLKSDLEKLAAGFDVKIPRYLINGTGKSVERSIPAVSKKIIIVEGMASLYGDLANLFDIKVYVDIDKKLQREFFLKRAKSRNQSKDNALKHWDYVCESAKKHIMPFKQKADLVVNAQAPLCYYSQLFEYIYRITNSFESF